MRVASSSLLLLLSSLQAAVSLPSEMISTELRLSQLETELESTRSTLLEILKSVSILSKQYVHTDEGVRLKTTEDIDMKIEKLQMKIDENKENVTGVVMAAVEALQKKFDALKEDLSFKLEKKVKRAYGSKFVTEESFEEVSKKVQQLQDLPKNLMQSVNEIKLDLPKTAIMKKEFSSFQLRVARDLAKVKFGEGEWVVFQRRGQHGNPADYFAREMAQYERGFGDPGAEFWLGLDKLATLTRDGGAELMVKLETFEGDTVHAHYSSFRVQGEDYRLQVSGYSGTAGDPLRIDNGMPFSALDRDRDSWEGDCSATRGGGGWWYNGCGLANLNGLNLGQQGAGYDGILWYLYANDNRSFKSSTMMIRKTKL